LILDSEAPILIWDAVGGGASSHGVTTSRAPVAVEGRALLSLTRGKAGTTTRAGLRTGRGGGGDAGGSGWGGRTYAARFCRRVCGVGVLSPVGVDEPEAGGEVDFGEAAPEGDDSELDLECFSTEFARRRPDLV